MQISDPNQPGLAIRGCEYLRAPIVMGKPSADGGPNETSGSVVDVHDRFADHHAVSKGHDALSPFQLRINYKSRNQPGVQSADVPQSRPNIITTCFGQQFLSNRSHVFSNLKLARAPARLRRGRACVVSPGGVNAPMEVVSESRWQVLRSSAVGLFLVSKLSKPHARQLGKTGSPFLRPLPALSPVPNCRARCGCAERLSQPCASLLPTGKAARPRRQAMCLAARCNRNKAHEPAVDRQLAIMFRCVFKERNNEFCGLWIPRCFSTPYGDADGRRTSFQRRYGARFRSVLREGQFVGSIIGRFAGHAIRNVLIPERHVPQHSPVGAYTVHRRALDSVFRKYFSKTFDFSGDLLPPVRQERRQCIS